MSETIHEAFERNTVRRMHRDGRVSYRCRKGLWSVTGPNRHTAEREAMWYFVRYYADGEYGTGEAEQS